MENTLIQTINKATQMPVASATPTPTPVQEPHRMREAQDVLHQLQSLLLGETSTGKEILSEVLQKAEKLTVEAALQIDLDPGTRKTLEDISALILSARQLGRNKGIDERLHKIFVESQKALEAARGPDVSDATKVATNSVLEYVGTWRPLFYLITSSRDFRQLVLDLVRIARNVAYSYEEPVETAKQQFVEGMPKKEIAETTKEQVKQIGAPELTDEEWDLILIDIQNVLIRLSKSPEYHQGIMNMFSLLDMFQKTLVNPPSAEPQNIHVKRIVLETEELVSSFSGKDTFENFKTHLRRLMDTIQRNENIHCYLSELKEFVLKLRKEEEIQSEEFKSRSKELAHRGRELFREIKDDDDFRPFFNSINAMINNIKNDEFVQMLRHHAGIVQSDLSFVDKQGQVQVNIDVLSKLQTSLLPILADSLKYIPIPRVHSTDNNREFWLDNIVLCGYDVIPENIKFHLESDTELSLRDIETKNTRTNLVIKLDKLLTEFKDVEFYYNKKSFPTLEERGKATFRIKGDGANMTLTYELGQKEDGTLTVTKGFANFNISDMDIEFDKSTLSHPVIVPTLTTLFLVQIKNQIEERIEDNLTGFIGKLGDMLTTALSPFNTPVQAGLELAKKAVKATPFAQIADKRKEILE